MKIPKTPPDSSELIGRLAKTPGALGRVQAVWGDTVRADPGYVHWDKLLHLTPPHGLSHEEWWFILKTSRQGARELPLVDRSGTPVRFSTPDAALEILSEVDKGASGRLLMAEEVTNPETRDRYSVSSLIEEAITSSQIEGAAVTRDVAKQMLRSGRRPRTKDERMVLNNYEAIEFIRDRKSEPLSPEFVFELHRIVTSKTLDSPDEEGRLRRPEEDIRITDHGTETILYQPPAAEELPARLQVMCDFANGKAPNYFVHDVVRSVLLHFWLAYDHPFVDGNGRTARALFYWSMLSRDYWLVEFLSISQIIRKRQAKYGRSFLYVETDDNDATYFLLDQLEILKAAVQELSIYLREKMAQTRAATKLLRESDLNHRQLALLGHALRHKHHEYTMQSHRRSHGVAYQTARTDLLDLEARGLMEHRKVGKRMVFSVSSDWLARL